jgi:hypothetical protein
MDLKDTARAAARHLLRPIARLLIRLGVPFGDFVEVAKEAWVAVALEDYGLRGRPTNLSRVAMLTGLSRKEATRIRDRLAAQAPAAGDDESQPLARVLSGWHQDPDFSDFGSPRELPLEGARGLAGLFSRYGGGLPATALRKELVRVGAMAVEGDRARALARYYMPEDLAPQSVQRYGSVLADLGDTLNHNVLRSDPDRPRFEGRAVNLQMPRGALDAFRTWLEERGETLLEDADDWLTRHEQEGGELRLGVGLYLICEEPAGGRRRRSTSDAGDPGAVSDPEEDSP